MSPWVSMSTATVNPTLFEIADLDEFRAELGQLATCVESEDVALVRGLVSTELVREVLGRIANTFTTAADSTVDFKSHVRDPREIPNYQRLTLGENRVLYEEFTAPGDILIYNGRTTQGVQTIDPHVLPELGLPGGRYSATVTLYRVPQR